MPRISMFRKRSLNETLRAALDVPFGTTGKLDGNQGNAQIGALLTSEMRHGFGDRYFERRLNRTGQEMAAAHGAVLQAKHRMQMKAGFAIITFGDIAHQAQDLALLLHLNWFVFFGGEVEPADLGL